MVRTRTQAKQENESSDDPEPMDIDDDDLAVMWSPALSEVLMLSSAGSDIQLPQFLSGSLAQAVDTAFNSLKYRVYCIQKNRICNTVSTKQLVN